MLTHKRISEILEYHPDTGWLTWLALPNQASTTRFSGKRAGTRHAAGYRQIQIDGKAYKAHRLVWLLVYGDWPPIAVDHINGDADDNRIENLRLANSSQNGANSRQRRKNPKHLKGAVYHKTSGLWRAEITKNYIRRYLGYFKTEMEAHQAYVDAAKLLHGEFFCSG
jgi:hypothetical protein